MNTLFPKQFIKAADEICDYDHHVPAPLFRKVFSLPQLPEEAFVCLCGLGFYELYVNGTRITRGALAPYIANPDDILYYDLYDIASYLQTGENVVGVMLGNGFFNPFGGSIWDFDKAPWRGPLRLAMEIRWTADGETHVLPSDESFRVAESPVRFDELRVGAFYDANLEKEGWNQPGYDDSGWSHASLAPAPKGEPRVSQAEPVTVYRELRPVSIQHEDDFCFCCRTNAAYTDPIEATRVKDTYLYDFGENNTGVCRLRIHGEKGQTVKLRFAELMVDGHFTISTTIFIRPGTDFYFDYPQMDMYTLKGGEEEIYVPPFTYHGFRYVLVEGITADQATPDLLTYLVMSSDMRERAAFTCSDETINRLYEITRRSDRSNFVFLPTDCPHREKNGWTADAALSCEHMLLTMTAEHSFREWLHSIRKAQREDGALPGIVPTAGWGFAWGNGPAWDCVCVYLPYFCHKYTGDTEILKENAGMIRRYLQYVAGRRDADGLLAIGLGDWVQPMYDNQNPQAPLRVTDSLMTLDIARKAAAIFGRIGDTEGEAAACRLATELRTAIRTHLLDTDQALIEGHCQTSQVLAMTCGIFDKEEVPQAFAQLLRFIHEAGDRLACGVLGGRHLFHLLAQHGEADLACRLIVGPGYPSYGYWLENGATTLCEAFRQPGERRDSQNHHFWGDIASFFIQELAGIHPNPAWRDPTEFEIAPAFAESLQHAQASYILPDDSRLSISWHRDGGDIQLLVSAPAAAHGQMRLPEGWLFAGGISVRPLASGEYRLQCH